MAGISICAAIILMPPFKYSFWVFLLDFALFVYWMVLFGLLEKCKLYNSLPLPRGSAWILSDVLTWNNSSPEPVVATHTGIGIIGGYY